MTPSVMKKVCDTNYLFNKIFLFHRDYHTHHQQRHWWSQALWGLLSRPMAWNLPMASTFAGLPLATTSGFRRRYINLHQVCLVVVMSWTDDMENLMCFKVFQRKDNDYTTFGQWSLMIFSFPRDVFRAPKIDSPVGNPKRWDFRCFTFIRSYSYPPPAVPLQLLQHLAFLGWQFQIGLMWGW